MTLLSRREGSNGVYSEGLERSITDDRSRNYLLYFSAILMEKKERHAYEHIRKGQSQSQKAGQWERGAHFFLVVCLCAFSSACELRVLSLSSKTGAGAWLCVRCLLALDFLHFALRFGFEIRIRILVVLGVVLWIVALVCEGVFGKIVV